MTTWDFSPPDHVLDENTRKMVIAIINAARAVVGTIPDGGPDRQSLACLLTIAAGYHATYTPQGETAKAPFDELSILENWRLGGRQASVAAERRDIMFPPEAFKAPGKRNPSADEVRGMEWWNGLSEAMRAHWLREAGSAVPAAAWAAFKQRNVREHDET